MITPCAACEQVAERMAGAAPRVERERLLGEAEVLQVFQLHDGKRSSASSGNGDAPAVAGCRITEGSIRASAAFRVLRNGVEVRLTGCAACDTGSQRSGRECHGCRT